MLNLTLKLNRHDLKTLNEILPVMFDHVQPILTVQDWLHYFNFRALSKKVFDKNFSVQWKKTKSVTLAININEFNSLTGIKNACNALLAQENYLYYKILLEQIIGTLDKQTVELMSADGFSHRQLE